MSPLNPSHIANDNGRRKSITGLFGDLLDAEYSTKITIGDIVNLMGARGYGVLILVLNLPNLIPLPLPGLSAIFGVPMALIGLQMFLGLKRPWVPKAILNKSFDRENLLHMFQKATPVLRRVERVLSPRLLFLSEGVMRNIIGAVLMVLAGVMALPIPLGNLILAIPIALIALGLIEKDGIAIMAGFILGAAALAFNLTIVYVGAEAVMGILGGLF